MERRTGNRRCGSRTCCCDAPDRIQDMKVSFDATLQCVLGAPILGTVCRWPLTATDTAGFRAEASMSALS